MTTKQSTRINPSTSSPNVPKIMACRNSMIRFNPAPGESVFTPPTTPLYRLYVTVSSVETQGELLLSARGRANGKWYSFVPITLPVVVVGKHLSLTTFCASVPLDSTTIELEYIITRNGEEENVGTVLICSQVKQSDLAYPMQTTVEIPEDVLETSLPLPWLKLEDWEGWCWLRSRYEESFLL